MKTITKRLEIDAGHRLMKHEGKCKHVHGHHYAFEITVGAEQLDQVGRVIDFSVIKEKVGGWLDANWDHGFIAEEKDPIIGWLTRQAQKFWVADAPPTIENLVRWLYLKAADLLAADGVIVLAVLGYETPTSSSTYSIEDAADEGHGFARNALIKMEVAASWRVR